MHMFLFFCFFLILCWQTFTFYSKSLFYFLPRLISAYAQTNTMLCDEFKHSENWIYSVPGTVKLITPQNALVLYQKTKKKGQRLNPIKFSKSVPKERTLLKQKKCCSKDCGWSRPNPPNPALSHSPSHLLCAVRGKNKWRDRQCVYVCMFGREKHKWTCKLLYECACLRVRGHIGMHQCLWHKAGPRLDLTLCRMPPWRQSDFVWPHASTEEAMEKICGPVSLRDYMAPLVSGLNNASNPVVPCHCNLELSSLEKKKNQISVPSQIFGHWHFWRACSWACAHTCA